MINLYSYYHIKDNEYEDEGYIEICSNDDDPTWPVIKHMAMGGEGIHKVNQIIYLDPRQVAPLIEALSKFLPKGK